MAINLDSPELPDLLGRSAILRAKQCFSEAIAMVEVRIGDMSDDARVPAYLAMLWAAEEAGFSDKAKACATKLKALDPDIPAVSRVLGK